MTAILIPVVWVPAAWCLQAQAAAGNAAEKPCTPAQEYIRSSRYLKKQKHVELSDADLAKISEQVSRGCRGGARRFEDTIDVLSKAGFPAKTLIETALEQSRSSDDRTDLFLTIFQITFARDGFDLSARDALELSSRLAAPSASGDGSFGVPRADREATLKPARNAFKDISLQCLREARRGGWELPRIDCARRAADIALPILEGKLNGNRVPDTLREFVAFTARSTEGPAMPLRASLDLGQELLGLSEEAPLEYIKGWLHAVSEDGLRLPKPQASEFALKLVKQGSNGSRQQPASVSPHDQKR